MAGQDDSLTEAHGRSGLSLATGADAFPENPWAAFPAAGPSELRTLEAWALAWHGAPRDMAVAEHFCRATLPPGRVLVHGAGSHSAWLIPALKAMPGVEPVGVLDRMAGALTDFHGLPVHPPAEARFLDADYVLVAHTSFEQEMVTALTAAGYPADRIRTLYSSPGYAAFSRERVGALVEAAATGPVDNLVVTSATAEVVPERMLAGLLEGGRTLHAFLGRAAGSDPSSLFETVDLLESLQALKALLQRVRPRTVYVRTILYKNFLLPLIKLWSPDSVVIGEPYDLTILWSDRDLELLFGLDAQSIRMLRLGERLAGGTDMLVSKRGGALWERVARPWQAESVLFFPALQAPPGERRAPGSLGDIVYAGFFPAAAFLKDFRSGYNFVPVLTDLCRQSGMTAALYNSAHMPGAGDGLFAEYLETLTGPLHYHPRLPYADMLSALTGYRYGWLCDHRDRFQGDRHVCVCNRWTSYICAGLPVLIDKDWSFMGDLTRRFGAGIIVDTLTPDAIRAQFAAADYPALQAGAESLRRHLDTCNGKVLDRIAARIDGGTRQTLQPN